MTKNQKIGAGVGIAILLIGGIIIYRKLRKTGDSGGDSGEGEGEGGGGGGGGGGPVLGEKRPGADPTIVVAPVYIPPSRRVVIATAPVSNTGVPGGRGATVPGGGTRVAPRQTWNAPKAPVASRTDVTMRSA